MASFCVSSVAALQHTHYAGWPEPAETGLRQTRRLGNNTVTVLQADSRLLHGSQNGRGVFRSDAAQSRDVRETVFAHLQTVMHVRAGRQPWELSTYGDRGSLCAVIHGGHHPEWSLACLSSWWIVSWRALPSAKSGFFSPLLSGRKEEEEEEGGGDVLLWRWWEEGRKEEGKESKIVCSSCRNTEGEEWLICMFPLLYVCMCVFSFIMCNILYCSDSWATASYTGLILKASDRNPRITVVFLWATLSFEIRLLGCKCV